MTPTELWEIMRAALLDAERQGVNEYGDPDGASAPTRLLYVIALALMDDFKRRYRGAKGLAWNPEAEVQREPGGLRAMEPDMGAAPIVAHSTHAFPPGEKCLTVGQLITLLHGFDPDRKVTIREADCGVFGAETEGVEWVVLT